MSDSKTTYRIEIVRDDKVGVYIATSPDIPGLVAECESLAELWEVIGDLAPDLILHNVGEP